MNQLEEAIIKGAAIAQRDYFKMTDGWWLSHGPESFFMCVMAKHVASICKYRVFVEASPKKIKLERGVEHKVEPSQRFDAVIWLRSSDDVKAIIEIKRAYSIDPLRKDRDKILRFMENPENEHVRAGYLLAYTEAKGKNREVTLENRLSNWATKLNCQLVAEKHNSKGDGESGWAIGLLRLNGINYN